MCLVLSIGTNSYGQQNPEELQCGFDLIESNLYAAELPASFVRTNEGTYIIPVVVHVIHNHGPENISDAQILSGIDAMNAQFSGADGGTDSEIRFRLATIDPNGNCTNGIVRIQSDKTGVAAGGNTGNECFLTDLEKCDLSRWNTAKYMNIWIIEKIKGANPIGCDDTPIRGYATLPGGNPLRDGITVKYKHFGTIETAYFGDQSQNINTDTHEGGHYFGLYHSNNAFGNSCATECEMLSSANCLNSGDRVCDTAPANTGVSTLDCSNIPLSCTDCEGFDLTNYIYPIDNYMSPNTKCHYRFTPGQIERMHGFLETHSSRINLWSSNNLTVTGTSDDIYDGLLQISASIIPATCQTNAFDGNISLSVSNGTGPYTYLWNTAASTSTISGLNGGWYSVEVTDWESGCSTLAAFWVPSPYLEYDVVGHCVGSSGSGIIDITVFNGSGNILNNNTYQWSNGAITEDLFGVTYLLYGATYDVAVTTAGGCVLQESFVVPLVQAPIINAQHITQIIQPSCEQYWGSIYTYVDDITNPLTSIHTWINAQNQVVGTSQNLEFAPPGTYQLTVQNPFTGCTSYPYSIQINPDFEFTQTAIYNVTSNQTLTGYHSFLENIEIESGATLTVNNAQLKFASNAGIIVNPGGRLVVNNSSVLTKVDCVNHWKGITVRGIPTISQQGSDVQFQGRFTMTNSTVEHALTGVSNGELHKYYSNTGGIIQVVNSTFLNCRTAVLLQDYVFINPVTGNNQNLNCKFYNSHFLWDANHLSLNGDYPMVRINKVWNPLFSGCRFENTNSNLFTYPNTSYKKAAIYGTWCRVTVEKGCPGAPSVICAYGATSVPSIIRGFNYGAVLHVSGNSSVTETLFSNFRSTWFENSTSLRLTQNNFINLPLSLIGYAGQQNPDDPEWFLHYGAYFDKSSAYWIEGNTFNLPTSAADFGLVIRNSGPNYNRVYKNTFSGLTSGAVSYDKNRGNNPTVGLKYECNNFSTNIFDIWVTNIASSQPGWGISQYQGSEAVGLNPAFPAGNTFNASTSFNVSNGLEWVNYYYRSSENLTTHSSINAILIQEPNSCPSSFPGGGGELELLMAQNDYNEAELLRTQLDQMVDGGDSEMLTEQVVYSTYSQALELYYELMSLSPALSTEVMVEAIKKEYELPAALLTMILSSNPHAAKSTRIQDELDSRMVPLSTYQRAMIDQGLDLVSYKEQLEARQSHLMARSNAALGRYIHYLSNDSTILNSMESIGDLAEAYKLPSLEYALAEMELAAGKYSQAASRLATLSGRIPFDNEDIERHQDYMTVVGVALQKWQTGDTTLSAIEQNTLYALSAADNNPASTLANLLLAEFTDYTFREKLKMPGEDGKSNKLIPTQLREASDRQCSLFPNPTGGLVTIVPPLGIDVFNVEISDPNGRVVLKERTTLSRLQKPILLDMAVFGAGLYFVKMTDNEGKVHETHKLQILK